MAFIIVAVNNKQETGMDQVQQEMERDLQRMKVEAEDVAQFAADMGCDMDKLQSFCWLAGIKCPTNKTGDEQ